MELMFYLGFYVILLLELLTKKPQSFVFKRNVRF